MQKGLIAGLAALLVACCGTVGLDACGDKFLLIGRAVKYQKAYASAHPGSIVLYESPGSHLTVVARQLNLQQLLVGAGHKVQIISDVSALDQAMSAGADLIVADSSDIEQIAPAVQRRGARLLPVLDRPTREGLTASGGAHRGVLRAPAQNAHALARFDSRPQVQP